MRCRRHRFTFSLLARLAAALLLLSPWCGLSEQPLAPGALTAEVAQLAAGAGTIFVGQIVAIHRNAGAVEVSFRVEQAVRGSLPAAVRVNGQTSAPVLVMREWAGTWAPGQQRYLLGARVLAFLHQASAAGFASPVHGSEGLVPVLVQGAGRAPLVDLRRVAASVVRGRATPLPTLAQAAVPLNTLLPVIAANAPATGLRGSVGALPAGAKPTDGALQSLLPHHVLDGTMLPGADRHAAL